MGEPIQFDRSATNLCKGIAICIMVYFHLFGATDESWFSPVFPVMYHVLGPYGNICVVFFSLLTGYGFAVSNLNRDVPYPSRVFPKLVRLYSNYWIIFGLMFLLLPVISDRRWVDIYGADPLAFVQHFLVNALGMSHLLYGGGVCTLSQTWWYVSLALIVILVLPLLCSLWRRLGWWSMAVVLGVALLLPDFRYTGYIPSVLLGVGLADRDGFVKLNQKGRNLIGVCVRILLLGVVLFVWYRWRRFGLYQVLADTLGAWAVCQFGFDVLRPIPVVRPVLCWLGKHSGNVFYLHSFVLGAAYVTSPYVFSFKYDLLIWMATMAITCAASVALEWGKKLTHYQKPFSKLEQAFSARMPRYEGEST